MNEKALGLSDAEATPADLAELAIINAKEAIALLEASPNDWVLAKFALDHLAAATDLVLKQKQLLADNAPSKAVGNWRGK